MPSAATRTAARRRNARAATRPARRPARTRPLRIRWERVGRVVLLIVLAVVVGLYVQQALTYWSVHNQADQQRSIARRLSRQNATLVQEEKSLNDPATITRVARELGMVRPGERPYVVTGLPRG